MVRMYDRVTVDSCKYCEFLPLYKTRGNNWKYRPVEPYIKNTFKLASDMRTHVYSFYSKENKRVEVKIKIVCAEPIHSILKVQFVDLVKCCCISGSVIHEVLDDYGLSYNSNLNTTADKKAIINAYAVDVEPIDESMENGYVFYTV